MSPSFHTRHHEALVRLQSTDELDALIARQDTRVCRHGSSLRTWIFEWGRVIDPGRPHIRLLMRAADDVGERVTIDLGLPGGEVDPLFGPVNLRWFPEDPKLDTLASVIGGYPSVDIVRYRPNKRCTMRTGSGDYVKVFADDRGSRLFDEGVDLWCASQRGELGFAVAEPLGFEVDTRAYRQAPVEGAPAGDRLFGGDGPSIARRLGETCATTTMAALTPTNLLGPVDELRRTQCRAAELDTYLPDERARIVEFIAVLEALHSSLEDRPLVPIHGSPHPSQWLIAGDTIGLVDFDRLSLGDPELDIATFAAEVEFERGDHNAVQAGFETGYRRRYSQLDSARLSAYRAHKRFAKVYRTAKSLRPNADIRASAYLDLVLSGLAGTP